MSYNTVLNKKQILQHCSETANNSTVLWSENSINQIATHVRYYIELLWLENSIVQIELHYNTALNKK